MNHQQPQPNQNIEIVEIKELNEISVGPGKPNNSFLAITILIAGVMISGSLLYAAKGGRPAGSAITTPPPDGQQPPGTPTTPTAQVSLPPVGDRDVILGNANAPVTVIEYGDYQCPFCGRFFSQVEPQLRDQYIKTGKVKMVYRNFQFLGQESIAAGVAAECAKDQSKFWPFHDALYTAEIKDGHENSGNLTRDLFIKLAGGVGIDTQQFTSCYDSNKYVARIEKDRDAATAVGVNSTPTTYVNGKIIQGAQPFTAFAVAIDAELNKK
jgi:protein-disulfide isomerase